MKKITIILILSLAFAKCSEVSNKKTKPDQTKKTVVTSTKKVNKTSKPKPEKPKQEIKPINSDLDLVLNIQAVGSESNILVSGKTNLPEGTKLGLELTKNGKTRAQNFDVYVKNGEFKGLFPVSISKVDHANVTCYENDMWQSESILSQLKFFKSAKWKDDTFGRVITLGSKITNKDLQTVKRIITPPKNYSNIAKIDGKVQDVSMGSIKRLSCNLDFVKKPSNDELSKEVRFWLFKIWTENQNAKAITIKCFTPDSQMSFKNGVFAPYGKWERANSSVDLKEYQVTIK